MINAVVIIGRLTRDPELRSTSSGNAVANFTLACERRFKGQNGEKTTDFFPVIVWGKLAEICGQYLSKGQLAGVEGTLQNRQWEAKDGSKRTTTEIIASDVQFLSAPAGASRSDDMGEEMTPLDDVPFD